MAREHDMGQLVFQFQTKEVKDYDRGPLWYGIFGSFVLGMIFLGIVTDSWPMALVFFLLGAVYILVSLSPAEDMEVAITDMGVLLGTSFFPYSEMEAFYIVFHPPKVQTLHFVRQGRFKRDLLIHIEDQSPAAIGEYLTSQLPELSGVKEHPVDKCIRLLKL